MLAFLLKRDKRGGGNNGYCHIFIKSAFHGSVKKKGKKTVKMQNCSLMLIVHVKQLIIKMKDDRIIFFSLNYIYILWQDTFL